MRSREELIQHVERGGVVEDRFFWGHTPKRADDDESLARILAAPSPKAVKAIGREVRGFDRTVWEAARFDAVVQGNVAKFGQHDDLRAFLLATKEQVLVEASPEDRIWGIGLGAEEPDARVPSRWLGANLLGFALMRAREALA